MKNDHAHQQNKKPSFNPSEAMGSINNGMNNMNDFMDFSNLRKQFTKNMETLNNVGHSFLELGKEASKRATEVMQNNAKMAMDMMHNMSHSNNHNDQSHQAHQAEKISSAVEHMSCQSKEFSNKCAEVDNDVVDV